MAKQPKTKKKAPKTEDVLDGYEKWLKKQKPVDVRAKSGYVSSSKEE
jgi:hypothetical protein